MNLFSKPLAENIKKMDRKTFSVLTINKIIMKRFWW